MVMVFCTPAFSLFGIYLVLPRGIGIDDVILLPQYTLYLLYLNQRGEKFVFFLIHLNRK